MRFKNAGGNLAVIAIMSLFCLAVLIYGLCASYYGLLLFQKGALNFVLGLFFLICIGLPSLYWVVTTSYRYFSAVPTYINQRKIRVINPFLVDEKGLYSDTERWLCNTVRDIAIADYKIVTNLQLFYNRGKEDGEV